MNIALGRQLRTSSFICQLTFCAVLLSAPFVADAQPTCTLPPGTPFNPYSAKPDPASYSNDSHTYNPYTSANNDIANLHHEPKDPSDPGRWITKSYSVGATGSNQMGLDTYVVASITDSKRNPTAFGTFLLITNAGSTPVYFGLAGVLNNRLLPKQTQLLSLSIYQPATGPKHIVTQNVTLKYWDSGVMAAGSSDTPSKVCPTSLEYFQSLDATPRPDYQKIRLRLPWHYPADFKLAPNQQQFSNLGYPADPKNGSLTLSRNGQSFSYSIKNDEAVPLFMDLTCQIPEPDGVMWRTSYGYIAVAAGTTRTGSFEFTPRDALTTASCHAAFMEGAPSTPAPHPIQVPDIDLGIRVVTCSAVNGDC